MSHLFDPLRLRGITLPNRIAVSPMCQYSCVEGFPNEWHLVHLGSRAVGGAGLVFTEATAVVPEGRISPQDLGMWSDDHVDSFSRIVHFIHEQGSTAAIQLAHAGRKASTYRPWDGNGVVPKSSGGWDNVAAPSPIPFADGYAIPQALTETEIHATVTAFAQAARRALQAGFRAAEIHAAHGYLLNEFLSPLSNQRTDRYGGSFENRTRLLREVVTAIREVWPDRHPLFVRISVTDWAEGGWSLEDSVELVRHLKPLGIDLVDCSSGGNVARAQMPVGPGYQVPFAERIRHETGVPTAAVGMITAAVQADHIIRTGQADMVLLARQMLRDPYWPLHAAAALGQAMPWPPQYLRAAAGGTTARPMPRLEPLSTLSTGRP